MTHTVATLHPIETVAFDHATLAAFCTAEGPRAEETITKALTDVETLIAQIGAQGDHVRGVMRSCAELQRISALIGMTTIRDAAGAVLTCLAQDDATALRACIARLVRLGEPKQTGGWAMERTPDTVA
ncbi:hypothetical protein [Jannaschia donghaensis]|uniref:Uncharacterized protein n=1 Tax=Jannaschia donghaensis TaxID=420998 RepID=A0A0M6YHH0_9RHOB|nr:hypothetical protein [Jannaschia donghaensis]CTQ48953.1 hypothetical protein JDO7802_00961 [Jannaschia donghaensis]